MQRFCLRPIKPSAGLKDSYPLMGRTIAVGRHPFNDIVIQDESVSRFHARLAPQDDGLQVTDLNSRNGTYLEQERVETARVGPGQAVAFGNIAFRCEPLAVPSSSGEEVPDKYPIRLVIRDHAQRPLLEADARRGVAVTLAELLAAPSERETASGPLRRLATLYRLTTILRCAPDESRLLEDCLGLVFDAVPADRGVILLRDGPDGELRPRAARSRGPGFSPGPIAVSRTIIDRCMRERVAIVSEDATSDERFKASHSVQLHEIRSTMVVPLAAPTAILGVLCLDTRQLVQAFSQDDLHFTATLAGDIALFLDRQRMSEESLRVGEMAAVGEVITDLAHNVKNILQVSESAASLMDLYVRSGDLDSLRKTWPKMERTLDLISSLVKEVLDYSRAPSINRTRCGLNGLIARVCENVKPEFEAKGIALRLRLDDRIGDLNLDACGLERALLNLLVNARDAVTHDRGEIAVATGSGPGGDVVMSVEDNGEGIPADRLPRLFLPRFSTKGEQGTGLGLAMVKKWTSAVGATIQVHSVVGEGTRFVLAFPREMTGLGTPTAPTAPR
ncbi:MAG: FHA domain-containing protein [Elusimicrobia bacterium]|nr:FHA domain-containing protein [Elusimicrobiota bacterium]